MPQIQLKDGALSSASYVKATGRYTCPKGTVTEFTLSWPEGLIANVTENLSVGNVQCTCCGVTATFPAGKHYVKDGVLVHEYPAAP